VRPRAQSFLRGDIDCAKNATLRERQNRNKIMARETFANIFVKAQGMKKERLHFHGTAVIIRVIGE